MSLFIGTFLCHYYLFGPFVSLFIGTFLCHYYLFGLFCVTIIYLDLFVSLLLILTVANVSKVIYETLVSHQRNQRKT